jgi:hypothetical protein
MAQISPELLESEWETYNGLKNFLREKSTSFGEDMHSKYGFNDESLLVLSDHDAYDRIKSKHAINPEEYK